MSQMSEGKKQLVGFLVVMTIVALLVSVVYLTFFSEDEPQPKKTLPKNIQEKYTLKPSLKIVSGELELDFPWKYGSQRELIYGESNYKNLIDINKTNIIGRSLWVNHDGNLYPAISGDHTSLTYNKFPDYMTWIIEVTNDNIKIDINKLTSNSKIKVLKNANEYGNDVLLINFRSSDYPDLSLELPVYFENDCLITSENPDEYFICNTLETTKKVIGDKDLEFFENPLDKLEQDRLTSPTDKVSWIDDVRASGGGRTITLHEEVSISDSFETNRKVVHLEERITIGDKIE